MTIEHPRISVRVGWIKHEILSALAAVDSLKSHELYAMFKPKAKDLSSSQFIAQHMMHMLAAGLVTEVTTGAWALTIDGRLKLRELNAQVLDGPKVKKAAIPISKDNYDGAELKQTCTRVGAYTAYGLPSRINGQIVERTRNV